MGYPYQLSYLQDIKFGGGIPSLGRQLYLVWNHEVGRIGKEFAIDKVRKGKVGGWLGVVLGPLLGRSKTARNGDFEVFALNTVQ